ncbi:MAG: MarR family transcriptional regulator [Clostridia bacterium]|nr:MarR family transcriptional regulator [Clostridia bacterium]
MMGTGLTERRKQFLQVLVDLYQRTQLPVHYEAIARALGVSKWTAYDMLKELEKLGFLTRSYAVHPGQSGRSTLVFVPTAQAEDLLARNRAATGGPWDWQTSRAGVLRLLQRTTELGPAEAVQRIVREMARVERGGAFCTYLLGLLLVYLRALGQEAVGFVRRLVDSAPSAETRLTLFVGTVVGTAMQTVGHGLGGELAAFIGRFVQYVCELSPPERTALREFLDEALAETARPPRPRAR